MSSKTKATQNNLNLNMNLIQPSGSTSPGQSSSVSQTIANYLIIFFDQSMDFKGKDSVGSKGATTVSCFLINMIGHIRHDQLLRTNQLNCSLFSQASPPWQSQAWPQQMPVQVRHHRRAKRKLMRRSIISRILKQDTAQEENIMNVLRLLWYQWTRNLTRNRFKYHNRW